MKEFHEPSFLLMDMSSSQLPKARSAVGHRVPGSSRRQAAPHQLHGPLPGGKTAHPAVNSKEMETYKDILLYPLLISIQLYFSIFFDEPIT